MRLEYADAVALGAVGIVGRASRVAARENLLHAWKPERPEVLRRGQEVLEVHRLPHQTPEVMDTAVRSALPPDDRWMVLPEVNALFERQLRIEDERTHVDVTTERSGVDRLPD